MAVLDDIKSGPEKAKKNSLLVIKYFNCIKTFVEQKKIMTAHTSSIDQQLFPLYQLLETNMRVGIDEYILLILSSELKSLQKVTPVLLEVFIYFTKIFEKNECTFGNLFMTLNYYILYGDEEIKCGK